MAGIYLHIPFCRSRCFYCDFFSTTRLECKTVYVNTLCRELAQRNTWLGGEKIRSVYFGGGTPSLLSGEDFDCIFATLNEYFDLSGCEEITLEANPDDLTNDYLAMLHSQPFNRLSIGLQSLQDSELSMVNRRHTAQQATDSVLRAARFFDNISIDLIYAYPSQRLEDFLFSIKKMIELPVRHISAYQLTYEKGCILHQKLQKKQICEISDELSLEIYTNLVKILEKAGFHQYEISNFARTGFEAKHNSAYWTGSKYLGVGAAAHSFDGNSRRWNVASIEDYIAGINAGKAIAETEILSPTDKYNEMIITSLRTSRGLSLQALREQHGEKMLNYCLKNAEKHLKNNILIIENNFLHFSTQGFFLSDGVMGDLFYVE